MVTFSDIQSELNNFITQGKLIEYKIIEDRGSKVVINLVFKNSDDVIYSRNYVIAIYGRGTPNEQAFWVGSKPPELYTETQPQSPISEDVKNAIINDLETNYGMVVIEGVAVNPSNMTVRVDGYIRDPNDASKLVRKAYLARVNDDGTYQIFEVVV